MSRLKIIALGVFGFALIAPGLVRAQNPAPGAAPVQTTAAPQMQVVDLASIERLLGKDAAQIADAVRQTWEFVLVGDHDKKPIVTVGTLVSGVILLALSYIVAGI